MEMRKYSYFFILWLIVSSIQHKKIQILIHYKMCAFLTKQCNHLITMHRCILIYLDGIEKSYFLHDIS